MRYQLTHVCIVRKSMYGRLICKAVDFCLECNICIEGYIKILFLRRTFDSDINASYVFPPMTFFVRRLDVDGSLSSKATDDPISGKEEKRPNDLR